MVSDQKALKFRKWLMKLLGYNIEILYQAGLQNKAVGTDSLNGLEEVWKDEEM